MFITTEFILVSQDPARFEPKKLKILQSLTLLLQDGLERLAIPITLSLEDLDGITEDKVTLCLYDLDELRLHES